MNVNCVSVGYNKCGVLCSCLDVACCIFDFMECIIGGNIAVCIDDHHILFYHINMYNRMVCSHAGNIICPPLIATQSFIASFSLNVQHGLMSCFMHAVLYGKPPVTCVLRSCKCESFSIACYISCIVINAGMFIVALMAFMLSCMPGIHFCSLHGSSLIASH